MSIERRREARPESLNLLDYVTVDEKGQPGEYSIGRTLNISRGGMLMETHIPLSLGQQLKITLELREELIGVTGKIIYTTDASGRHQCGIEFLDVPDSDQHLLDRYVAAFHQL